MTTPTPEKIREHAESSNLTHPETGVRLGVWRVVDPSGTVADFVTRLGVTHKPLSGNDGAVVPVGTVVCQTASLGALYQCDVGDDHWSGFEWVPEVSA